VYALLDDTVTESTMTTPRSGSSSLNTSVKGKKAGGKGGSVKAPHSPKKASILSFTERKAAEVHADEVARAARQAHWTAVVEAELAGERVAAVTQTAVSASEHTTEAAAAEVTAATAALADAEAAMALAEADAAAANAAVTKLKTLPPPSSSPPSIDRKKSSSPAMKPLPSPSSKNSSQESGRRVRSRRPSMERTASSDKSSSQRSGAGDKDRSISGRSSKTGSGRGGRSRAASRESDADAEKRELINKYGVVWYRNRCLAEATARSDEEREKKRFMDGERKRISREMQTERRRVADHR
jgi:hypothetical protein